MRRREKNLVTIRAAPLPDNRNGIVVWGRIGTSGMIMSCLDEADDSSSRLQLGLDHLSEESMLILCCEVETCFENGEELFRTKGGETTNLL
ncbi:unnamed protein product [Linum trigynum]